MAKTAATGFSYARSFSGQDDYVSQDLLLAGSATVKIGDLVRVNTSGLLVRCATGEAPCGVLVGIVDKNGINVFSPRADSNSVLGATLTPDDQVTTASTNASDATKNIKGQVILEIDGENLYHNISDGTLAQTNLFQFFDVANGNQVTSGSASDANGQVQLIALDPDDSTAGYFRINENQFSGGLDSATAKNAA